MKWMTLVMAACCWSHASAQVAEPKGPPSAAPPQEVVRWIRANAVRAAIDKSPLEAAEAKAIDRITAGARVVGFGENNHGNHEPLAYRNRLIRYLVERRGLTAVALESGFAESRPLYDYVLGVPGDPQALLETGLTHGFGDLRENLELVEWLRRWNIGNPARRVRLYGIDHSTILSGPPGAKGHGVVLLHIDRYLQQTIPRESAKVRRELAGFASRFTENDYPAYSAADRRALARVLADTEALFRVYRGDMIRGSSAHDYAWAQREAFDAAQLPKLFAVWSVDGSDLGRLAQVIDIRDRAMASHVRWVLAREGRRGRVLLFQTNGHVTKSAMIGSVMRNFAVQPTLTGIALHNALGTKYRTIATVSSRARSAEDAGSGSLDRAFAAAGRAPVLLNLRPMQAARWWREVQSASQGDGRLDDYAPARAFDGAVYFDTLTPVKPLRTRSAP